MYAQGMPTKINTFLKRKISIALLKRLDPYGKSVVLELCHSSMTVTGDRDSLKTKLSVVDYLEADRSTTGTRTPTKMNYCMPGTTEP